MVVPTPDGVRNPLVLAAAHLAGVSRAFAIGGAQADRGARLRHRDDPRGRQDLRPGQRVRRRREAARLRHGRHRHGRGRLRDPGDRRRHRESGLGRAWISSRRPSTTSSRRRSCVSPDAALDRCGRRECAATAAADAARAPSSRRRSRIAARSSRCATWPRRPRSPIASHPSTSSSRSPIPMRCCPRSGTPARSSWATTRPRRSATTARDPTTCCRPAAPRASRRRSASTISRSARACCDLSPRRRARSGPSRRRSRDGEGLHRACRERPLQARRMSAAGKAARRRSPRD